VKELILIRHAKASWADPNVEDFERTINEKGRLNAPEMGRRMKSKALAPDALVSSPALRARTTAEFDIAQIVYDKGIYEADLKDLLHIVKNLDSQLSTVMMFGHNPTITDFTNYLTGEYIESIPTCGTVNIRFDCTDWSSIGKGSGSLVEFDYPKKKNPDA